MSKESLYAQLKNWYNNCIKEMEINTSRKAKHDRKISKKIYNKLMNKLNDIESTQ